MTTFNQYRQETADEMAERFWSKVATIPEHPCWEWCGTRGSGGYGDFSVGHRPKRAHRVAYELAVGAIPAGLHLDHLCRNRSCVNPAHLEPVTPKENALRGKSFSAEFALRTHCSNGHPFAEHNKIANWCGKFRRVCVVCARIARRKSDAKRRAAARVRTV